MAKRADIQSSELVVDLFAGGGGASTAIFNATGRHPDVAVNHNPNAIGVHEANHPNTRHYQCDVREVDPVEACSVGGELRPVGLLWMSPDCTHFSKARGGKPVEKGIRSLADVGLIWAQKVRPRLIHLENVEEFQDWGPVLENGKPCPDRKGLDFRRWVKALNDMGYAVDWKELVAADYGAPTTRKRLFLIARCDGEPIRWPDRTHVSRAELNERSLFGPQLEPWRSAAEIIDWTLPVPSIFERKKPLADKTLARIAKGIRRFVIEAPQPFIVPLTHAGERGHHDLDDPLRTVTGANRGEFALAAPHITKFRANSIGHDMRGPMHTITANGFEKRPGGAVPLGVASAMLVPRYGERDGQEPRVRDIEEPYPVVVPTGNGGDLGQVVLSGASVGVGGRAGQSPPRGLDDPLNTVTAKADRAAAVVFMQKMNQNGIGSSPEDPLVTVMAGAPRHYEVAAFLNRQFGSTVSGCDISEPAPTVMADGSGGKTGVVVTHIDKYYGSGVPADLQDPLDTATDKARFGLAATFLEQANTGVVGHAAEEPVSTVLAAGCHQRPVEVRLEEIEQASGPKRRKVLEFLWKHFGAPSESEWEAPAETLMGRLRFGLVRLGQTLWQIADIGLRMLVPRELFNAQGFPPDYIIDRTAPTAEYPEGRPITKTAQTSMAGNSVSPPPAEATLRANLTWMDLPERVAA